MNKEFLDFASDDGAVVLKKGENGKIEKIIGIGVMLNPTSELSPEYAELIKQTHSGTRHEKGARYACQHLDDYVIIISENKSLSILHGETSIIWRNEFFNNTENRK